MRKISEIAQIVLDYANENERLYTCYSTKVLYPNPYKEIDGISPEEHSYKKWIQSKMNTLKGAGTEKGKSEADSHGLIGAILYKNKASGYEICDRFQRANAGTKELKNLLKLRTKYIQRWIDEEKALDN